MAEQEVRMLVDGPGASFSPGSASTETRRLSEVEAVSRSLERLKHVRQALEARRVVTLDFAAKLAPDEPSGDVWTVMQLFRDPVQIETVAPEAIPRLLGVLRTVEVSLLARLTRDSLKHVGPSQAPPREDDRLLTVEEAAKLLGVTPRWLYRHAGRLPFARRLSRKALRFSEAGIGRYVATRAKS
jgi:excisionase family DNA binding protein